MSPRLTVAMIVRDESRMLDAFLEANAGLWDELLVVDTGSTDDTRERLSAAGARVLDTPWQRDFSRARNVSLRAARGDWVLVLDADERITPGFAAELRSAIAQPQLGALRVRISDQLPYGHRRDRWHLRAFRNDPSIHFEHPVRETAEASVHAFLAPRGLHLERLDAPILHVGYVAERDAGRKKKDRDVALLRERLALDPGALACWLRLLETARAWQDDVLWRDTARQATDLIETLGRELLSDAPWGGELVALIAEGLFAPDSPAGLVFLADWAPRLRPSTALLLRRGFFLESQGKRDEARADYLAALGSDTKETDSHEARVAPRLGLARLELARGQPPAALLHARLALESGPRDPEALLAVASLTRRLEGAEALKRWLEAHEALVPQCPERDWAVGEALLSSNEAAASLSYFRRAAGVPPAGPAGLRLAQALLGADQLEASERLARQLVSTQPEAGLGVLLFDLAAGRDTDLDLELTPESAHAAFKQWLEVMLQGRNRQLIRKVRARLVAVDGLFPWARAWLLKRSA